MLRTWAYCQLAGGWLETFRLRMRLVSKWAMLGEGDGGKFHISFSILPKRVVCYVQTSRLNELLHYLAFASGKCLKFMCTP